MAKVGDITLQFDEYFTSTRITQCLAECKFIQKDRIECIFKKVELDKNGKCIYFEKKEIV